MCCIQQAKHTCCRCIFKAMMVSYHLPHYRDEAAFQLCSSSMWVISLNPSCLPIASRWENIKVRREKKAQRECVHLSSWENRVTHPLLTAVEEVLRYKTDFLFSNIWLIHKRDLCARWYPAKTNSFDTWKTNLWHFHRNSYFAVLYYWLIYYQNVFKLVVNLFQERFLLEDLGS